MPARHRGITYLHLLPLVLQAQLASLSSELEASQLQLRTAQAATAEAVTAASASAAVAAQVRCCRAHVLLLQLCIGIKLPCVGASLQCVESRVGGPACCAGLHAVRAYMPSAGNTLQQTQPLHRPSCLPSPLLCLSQHRLLPPLSWRPRTARPPRRCKQRLRCCASSGLPARRRRRRSRERRGPTTPVAVHALQRSGCRLCACHHVVLSHYSCNPGSHPGIPSGCLLLCPGAGAAGSGTWRALGSRGPGSRRAAEGGGARGGAGGPAGGEWGQRHRSAFVCN